MMRRFLLSALVTLVSVGILAATAQAEQVHPGHDAADMNGDGTVSLSELKNYNRDQRGA